MFRSLLLLTVIALVSIFSVLPSNAYAQEADDIFTRFRKDMPKVPFMEEAEFIKKTKPVKKVPYGVKDLAYSVRIPKEWDEGKEIGTSNFLLSEKLFVELSAFKGKHTISGRSRLEVQAIKIDSNLTAEQWYLKYILEGGYTAEGFETHNENKVETLMVQTDGNFSYFVRSLAFLNGDYIVMARYFVPVQHIKNESVMQAQVIDSFNLTNRAKRKVADLDVYRFLDVAEVKYPQSWKVFAKPLRSVDYMDVTLMNIQEVKGHEIGGGSSSSSNGKIDIVVISAATRKSLIDEIKGYKKKIEAEGVLIGDRLSVYGDVGYSKDMEFHITEAYEGVDSSNNLSEYEFWFSVMVGGNYYYFLMLLTPSRNENFGVWSENIQNYKLMVNYFRPMAGAFLERN